MKVLVFGNVGSGKSTVLNKLKEIFPFKVIAIDDFRRKFSDGSKSGELDARDNFFAAIMPNQNQFLECIGVGKVADELYNLLETSQETVVCLTLLTPKEICEERLSNRIWDIPFPASLEKVSSLLERTEEKISNREINDKWSLRQNTIFLERQNVKPTDIQIIISDLKKVIQAQRNE
jgi:adenylate kinase family enzyme